LRADSKNGVKVEKQAKNDQVMGPQTSLTFEKNLFEPKPALPIALVPDMAEEI